MMAGAAKSTEALLKRLESDTPDRDSILVAVVIVAMALRRMPRSGSPRLVIAQRDGRRLTAFPRHLVHETIDEWIVASLEQHPPVMKATWTASGSVVVDEIDPDNDGDNNDTTFEWTWREVADGLASELRSLSSRTRPRKAVCCPNCRKEFFP